MTLSIHTDGGARGNPGLAGIGFVVKDESGNILHKAGQTIGTSTNNVAEYRAVIAALTWVADQQTSISKVASIRFFLDSSLVVNQLNGLFKVKEARLKELLTEIRFIESRIRSAIHYSHVAREKNQEADLLVNQALDGKWNT